MALLVASCATRPANFVRTVNPVQIPAVSATKVVETPYELRGYREVADPSVRHEAQTVYRRTRVSIKASNELPMVPRSTYPPASISPLPASAELTAELETQKHITGDLLSMQRSMSAAEQKMQSQYATLVRQSAEAVKVREQLEAERKRERGAAAAPTPGSANPGASAEVKW